jgi:hypothetical protein
MDIEGRLAGKDGGDATKARLGGANLNLPHHPTYPCR